MTRAELESLLRLGCEIRFREWRENGMPYRQLLVNDEYVATLEPAWVGQRWKGGEYRLNGCGPLAGFQSPLLKDLPDETHLRVALLAAIETWGGDPQ